MSKQIALWEWFTMTFTCKEFAGNNLKLNEKLCACLLL